MWQKIKERLARTLPFFFGVPVLLWQLLFFIVPLILILGLSVVNIQHNGQLTLTYFVTFFSSPYMYAIMRSLLLATTNAWLCLVIGYPIAYFLSFRAKKLKYVFLFLLIVPFWINFLLHVYAWYFVLERSGLLNTLLINAGIIQHPLMILNSIISVVIMMIYYYLPFMVLPLYAILEKFDVSLIEASLDLGASWIQTMRKIMIPITLPGILSGFFLVFVPSFAEFVIPELMQGDKNMYVGTIITRYVLGGTTISYGAAFTIISSVVLLIAAFGWYWAMKKLSKVL